MKATISLEEAALSYAKRGWPVFPLHNPINGLGQCSCGREDCDSPAKHPRTLHGLNDATTNEATIREWCTRWPYANIGIVTGAQSGLVVLDVDPRHSGHESLKELEQRYGPLPQTFETITGGDGRHIFFAHPGQQISNKVGFAPGLDIRGDGGYIVAPPSLHASGMGYHWEVAHHPDDTPLALISGWLLDLINAPTHSGGNGSAPVGEHIPKGERNATLTSLAGTMRRRGMGKNEILAALQVTNAERCVPQVADDELNRIAESVSKYPPAQNRLESYWWPVLDETVFYGLAGDIVRTIEPHTEADPVALLVSILAEFGVMIGRGPHMILDGSRHPLLINPVLVGKSSKSRKGSAGKRIKRIFQAVDIDWTRGQYRGTLSSGEGLVWAVRDEVWGKDKKGQEVLIDEGVQDKRLFLVQAEFGSVLRVMGRDGKSLSGVIRAAWDGEDLAPMTKMNRIRATAPHIGIIGHVTDDELRRHLTDTEASNGFGNRFMWFLVQRSKEKPFASSPSDFDLNPLIIRLHEALEFSKTMGEISMTEEAKTIWKAVYSQLSADRSGLAGALLNRAEASVMRLSALNALIASRNQIDVDHLEAALVLWEYAEKSTMMIFGDSIGDPVKDTILSAIRTSGGMTDTEIYNLFRRNVASSRLSRAKAELKAAGLIIDKAKTTEGRTQTIWRPTH